VLLQTHDLRGGKSVLVLVHVGVVDAEQGLIILVRVGEVLPRRVVLWTGQVLVPFPGGDLSCGIGTGVRPN